MEKEKDVRTLATQYMMYKIGKLRYMLYLFWDSDTVFKFTINFNNNRQKNNLAVRFWNIITKDTGH